MFPESSENYIKQTLCRHCGDMDATIQALLECNNEQFREESVKDDKQSGKSSTKFNDNKFKATEKTTKALSTVGTDAHLKNYVLSRQAEIGLGN